MTACMQLVAAAFFAVVTSLSAMSAQDKRPVISWFYQDFPPVFIVRGPMKGQGYAEQTVAYFTARMPQYKHTRVEAGLKRTFREMAFRDGLCTGGVFKSEEREKVMLFSNKVYDIVPNRVIVLHARKPVLAQFLNPAREIQLEALMADQQLTVGYAGDRYYGTQINKALGQLGQRSQVMRLPYDRYALMLSKGRIDFAFGFASEASYQFRTLGKPNSFVSYPIAGEPATIPGGIGCSKMPLGRQVISDINKIIAAEVDAPGYVQFYNSWLDENARQDVDINPDQHR